MSKAKLDKLNIDFDRYTAFGDAKGKNLELQLCSHDVVTGDEKALLDLTALLVERGCKVSDPDMSSIDIVLSRESLESQLNMLIHAVCRVLHMGDCQATLTFNHSGKSVTFSGRTCWSDDTYYLDNLWTCYLENPTEQLCETLRELPGVVQVMVEKINYVSAKALDIRVRSDVETCLASVVEVLTA